MIRTYVAILAASILLWVLAVVVATLVVTRLLDGPPCEWEDCIMLKDLPIDYCLRLGDPGCLIVPD